MESFQGQGQVQILVFSVFAGHMAWFPGWFQDNSESWYLSSTFEPWFFPEDGKWKSRSMNMIPVAQSFSYQPTFVFRDGLFSWCSFIFSSYSCTRSPLQATLHNKLTDIYVTFAFSPSKLGQVLDILPQQKSHESCSENDWYPWYFDHILFFFDHASWHVGSQFLFQGLNPCPLRWNHGVSITGWPGKSHFCGF